jgi:hypothetical protein
MSKMKNRIEAMIAEQKKPISLQMDRDSFNELESMEQLRFLLKASGLPIINPSSTFFYSI